MSGTTNTAEKLQAVQARVIEARDAVAAEAARVLRDAADRQEGLDDAARRAESVREAGKAFNPKSTAQAVEADVDGQPKASRGRRALDAIKGFFTAIGNGFERFGSYMKGRFTALGEWFKNLRKPKAETAPAVLVVENTQPEASVASGFRARLVEWLRNLRKPKTQEASVSTTGPVVEQEAVEQEVPASPRAFQSLGGTSPQTSPRAQVNAAPVLVTAAPVVEQPQQPAADVVVVAPLRRQSM